MGYGTIIARYFYLALSMFVVGGVIYVIEVYSDTATFAEIERQGEVLSMKVYNHNKSDHWHIDVNQMYEILKKAKAELAFGLISPPA